MKSLIELKEYFQGQVRESYNNFDLGVWKPEEYMGFMSKRAFDAYNDSGKLSETDFVSIISKITGDNSDLILKVLRSVFPDGILEWHHVYKRKKQCKEYFYNANQIVRACECYDEIKASVEKLNLRKENAKAELPALEKKLEEMESNLKTFTREKNIPDGYTVTIYSEMYGKYGWFESNRRYNLPEYYSGYIFETAEQKQEYLDLIEKIQELKELIYS